MLNPEAIQRELTKNKARSDLLKKVGPDKRFKSTGKVGFNPDGSVNLPSLREETRKEITKNTDEERGKLLKELDKELTKEIKKEKTPQTPKKKKLNMRKANAWKKRVILPRHDKKKFIYVKNKSKLKKDNKKKAEYTERTKTKVAREWEPSIEKIFESRGVEFLFAKQMKNRFKDNLTMEYFRTILNKMVEHGFLEVRKTKKGNIFRLKSDEPFEVPEDLRMKDFKLTAPDRNYQMAMNYKSKLKRILKSNGNPPRTYDQWAKYLKLARTSTYNLFGIYRKIGWAERTKVKAVKHHFTEEGLKEILGDEYEG